MRKGLRNICQMLSQKQATEARKNIPAAVVLGLDLSLLYLRNVAQLLANVAQHLRAMLRLGNVAQHAVLQKLSILGWPPNICFLSNLGSWTQSPLVVPETSCVCLLLEGRKQDLTNPEKYRMLLWGFANEEFHVDCNKLLLFT